MPEETWIGLLELRPRRTGVLDASAAGAFVNVLARASSATEFAANAAAYWVEDFEIVIVEDAEPIRRRIESSSSVDAGLIALAREVDRDGLARSGTLHIFPFEEEEKDSGKLD